MSLRYTYTGLFQHTIKPALLSFYETYLGFIDNFWVTARAIEWLDEVAKDEAFTDMEQINYEMFITAPPIRFALWVAMDALHYSNSKCQRMNRTRALRSSHDHSADSKTPLKWSDCEV